MMKAENTSKLRVGLSFSALLLAVMYVLSDIFIVETANSLQRGAIKGVAKVVPFLVLFCISMAVKHARNINLRVIVFVIFAIMIVQQVAVWQWLSAMNFSHAYWFFSHILGSYYQVERLILLAKIFMLLLIPFAHKSLLKIYSFVMSALFMCAVIYNIRAGIIMGNLFVTDTVLLCAEILFNMALYNFSDLLTPKNCSEILRGVLCFFLKPFFGDIFSEKYRDEDNDEPRCWA